MKISVIGLSGSGKSTLAMKLGKLYSLPVLHLDTLEFKKNWVLRDREDAKTLYRSFVESNESWVIDGNYSWLYQQQRLDDSDLILMLHFNRFSCLWRAISRYKKYKGKPRPDRASGCDEKLDFKFICWILFSSRLPSKENKRRFLRLKYASKLRYIKNQRQLYKFIAEVEHLSLSGQIPLR